MMLAQIRALMFADWCALQTNINRIRRSPGRCFLWCAYALSLIVLTVTRAFIGSSARPTSVLYQADSIVGAVVIAFGYSLVSGRTAIALFRTRVEARFIIGSLVRAPLAIAYLQSREALSAALRYSFVFVYVLFIVAPRSVGVVTALADLVLSIGIFAAGATLAVLRRLLGRGAGFAWAIVGIALCMLAAAPLARDAVVQLPAYVPPAFAVWILAVIPPWHPGSVLLAPDPRVFAGIITIALAGVCALAAAGRDAYPELYAFAVARIELREFARPSAVRAAVAMHRPAFVIPAPGALAFVWKSVIEFRRTVRTAYAAGGALTLVVAGFGAAHFFGPHDDIFPTALAIFANLLVLSGNQLALRLAVELRRPLFWLAPDSLFKRFCGLAVGQTWQRTLASILVGVGYGLGGGSLNRLLLLWLAIPAFIVLVTATGFAAFALFPNVADQRGPAVALRSFSSVLLLIPPAVVFVVAGVLIAPRVGLIGATLLAFVESGCLIGFAARQLDGRIDRVPA